MDWKGFTLTPEEERIIDEIIERKIGYTLGAPEPVRRRATPIVSRDPSTPNPDALRALYEELYRFATNNEKTPALTERKPTKKRP